MAIASPDIPANTLDLTGLRTKAGLSTREVGELMGLTHARIVQIEGVGTKDIDQIERLAKIYGVSEDLLRVANKLTRLGK